MGTNKKLGEKRREQMGFDLWEASVASRAAPGKEGRYHAYHNNNTICGIFIQRGWYFYNESKVNCPKCIGMMKQREER
jgi:hypothetical protein